jgi:putative ABC transport system permease protein
MHPLADHVPLSVRVLLKHPLRTVAVSGLLGACVAITTAVFAVVDGTLFKPLPFPEADRLAMIGRDLRSSGGARPAPVSRAQLQDLQHAPGIEAVAAFTSGALSGERTADDGLRSVAVTAGFFELLGVRPVVGRTLQRDDRAAGSVVPVILSHALWRTRFSSNPEIHGTLVMLGGVRCTIVGIAPAGFDFPLGASVWNLVDSADPATRNFMSLTAIARLRQQNSCPVEIGGARMQCEPLRRAFSPRTAWSLLLVLVAATTLVAMTWFQVACLELARSLARAREIGIRVAMGATRWRLAADSLSEATALGMGAMVAAVLILPALLSWLMSLLPGELSIGQPIAVDRRALLFSAVLALGVIGAVAAIPLQMLARVDPASLLRASITDRRRIRVTAPWVIVVAQVALSTGLVYLAGVTVRSMMAVNHVDLGYDPDRAVVVRLPSATAMGAGPDVYEQVAERLRGRSSIVALAGSDGRPLGGPTTVVNVGRPGDAQVMRARMVCVTPGYFRTLGVPLLGGRDFDARDTRASAFAVIVNRALARRLGFSDWVEGRRVTLLGLPATLVSMVGDTVLTRPDDPDQEVVFVPTTQWAPPTYLLADGAPGDAGRIQAIADVSAVLREMAPPGSYAVLPLADEARRVTAGYRARMILLLAIAAVALTLCAAGIYGGVTYAWTRVRRDVAVRLALGATPATIRQHLLRSLANRVALGITIGIVGGALAGRLGAAYLFGIAQFDLVSAAMAVLVLLTACGCAVLPPSIHIGRIQPSDFLRQD